MSQVGKGVRKRPRVKADGPEIVQSVEGVQADGQETIHNRAGGESTQNHLGFVAQEV